MTAPSSTTTTETADSTDTALSRERLDLLEALGAHRGFLRHTVQGITDEQANERTTVSQLTLGGLIKHVASTERGWADFIVDGPSDGSGGWDAEGGFSEEAVEAYSAGFRLVEGETLVGVLAEYDEVARRTDDLVRSLPDLDADHALPSAPWYQEGARWSARRVLVHIVAETAQHAGHADIIRESLDGQRTMG